MFAHVAIHLDILVFRYTCYKRKLVWTTFIASLHPVLHTFTALPHETSDCLFILSKQPSFPLAPTKKKLHTPPSQYFKGRVAAPRATLAWQTRRDSSFAVVLSWWSHCSQFWLLWGKAVPSKVCYHVTLSRAGGKEGGWVRRLREEWGWGSGKGLWSRSWRWAEFKFKAAERDCEPRVSWGGALMQTQGVLMWCVLEWMGLGGLTVTPHVNLSQRGVDSDGLIEKDRENTAISSYPPVRRECKITWNKWRVHRLLALQLKYHSKIPLLNHYLQLILFVRKYPLILINVQQQEGNLLEDRGFKIKKSSAE